MYLNSPRGSNNKLREQSNNVQNANRLFDSQNNAASGYQIGDDCKPACKDGNNNYDVTVEGATKGTMKFYQGSELYIEWHHQHGCGVGHPNLRCQIVLQYMTENDNPNIRDGTDQTSAGGDDDDPTEEETAEVSRGYHEPYDFYQTCTLDIFGHLWTSLDIFGHLWISWDTTLHLQHLQQSSLGVNEVL